MQRDIETLDVLPLHSHSHAARRTAYARTHLVCPVRICGGHMLRPPGAVCTYFGRIDVYVTSRDQNGPAQGWRRSRLDMDLTVWIPWGLGGGLLRALQDRWKTWRFRGPGGAETANLLGVGRRF